MKVEIRDTAIKNITNGLKMIEQNMKYWNDLVIDARRNNASDFIVNGFEEKREAYYHELFSAKQIICELGEEFKKAVETEMEAN